MSGPKRVLAMLLLASLLPLSHARAGEAEEPRLILDGGHAVQAGQVVVLEWTAAQEVGELEILLSLDGGRTYPLWISPQLDPGDRRFVWRVPPGLGPSVRMRIRYNRGGREIEGPPTASLAVIDSRAPQPLSLPLAPEDSARPAPGGDRDGSRSLRAAGAGRQDGPDAPAPSRSASLGDTRSTPHVIHQAEGPTFIPLRA